MALNTDINNSTLKLITILSLIVTSFDLCFMIINTIMFCVLNIESTNNDETMDDILLSYKNHKNMSQFTHTAHTNTHTNTNTNNINHNYKNNDNITEFNSEN